ncbi:MAG: ribosomal RNA small subunit methyltransferase A [Deltaproteobacteria bacterium]|nr:ribosomal RNA small subunit methyltransferase A [Deltaproteobacteria bacterium]
MVRAAHLPGAPRGAVRRELAALERRPRKRLAQHLLADPGVIRRIVELARLGGTETVLEIGPGLGALSGELASRAALLYLVEIDHDFAEQLRQRFAAASHVVVIEQDFLKTDLEALGAGPITVVANLPYNISTPVLFKLLEHADRFQRLVLMLQREVAERMRAAAGQREYSGLSVLVQFRAAVRLGLRVQPAAFVPRPKVESEVVVLEPYTSPPVSARDPRLFKRVVRAAFQQRRKQLVNSLGGVTPDPRCVLAAAAIDPKRRPETLSLAEFARLADAVANEARATAEKTERARAGPSEKESG